MKLMAYVMLKAMEATMHPKIHVGHRDKRDGGRNERSYNHHNNELDGIQEDKNKGS